MASDIIQPSIVDNFGSFHWQGNNVQPSPNCRRDINIREPRPSPIHHTPKFYTKEKRPNFLRLDSAGENIDCNSPGPQNTHCASGFENKSSSLFDCRTKRSSRNYNIPGESLPKARRTVPTHPSQLNLQSNKFLHSKSSLNSTELDQLATKFNSGLASNQKSTSCGIQGEPNQGNMAGSISESIQFQGETRTYPSLIPNPGVDPVLFSGYQRMPPQFRPPPPPANITHMTRNFMGMPISMLNFRPHPFSHPPPRWGGQPQLPFGPPVNFAQWAFNGHALPVQAVQQNSMGSPQVDVTHQGTQFRVPLHFVPSKQSPPRTKQSTCKQQPHPGRKKHSKPARNTEPMFTRILKRPTEAVASSDAATKENIVPVVDPITKLTESSSDPYKSCKVSKSQGQPGSRSPVENSSKLNAHSQTQPILRGSATAAESQSPDGRKNGIGGCGTKQRHSSIDFLLGGLKISQDTLSDSDFVDCDWDTLENPQHHDKDWVDSFVTDDPYNPLTGWRCSKRSPLDELAGNEDDHEINSRAHSSSTPWAGPSNNGTCDSRDFDSGTESGSDTESESDADSVDIPDERSECAEQQKTSVSARPGDSVQPIRCDNVNSTVRESEIGKPIRGSQEATSEGSNAHSSPKNVESSPEACSKRQRCLHPSISYVLGGYDDQRASDDGSDAESDDWDDFSDSDEESHPLPGAELSAQFAPPSRDNLRLFQFSNSQFKNPCHSPQVGAIGNQGPQKGITSPSAPCGPIFKPKARTVLITQRIICQVSDRPVSMIVPLEHSGRMSHTLMPSIQVSQRSPRRQSPTVGCLKLQHRSGCGLNSPKTSKQVHFSNKATLIVCPEPSHLVEEIRRTRRGPWLDYARDRCRFQHRITHLERVISPCLSLKHREKVAERFQLM